VLTTAEKKQNPATKTRTDRTLNMSLSRLAEPLRLFHPTDTLWGKQVLVLFRGFVAEERTPPKTGALGKDGLKMRCKTGKLLGVHSLVRLR